MGANEQQGNGVKVSWRWFVLCQGASLKVLPVPNVSLGQPTAGAPIRLKENGQRQIRNTEVLVQSRSKWELLAQLDRWRANAGWYQKVHEDRQKVASQAASHEQSVMEGKGSQKCHLEPSDEMTWWAVDGGRRRHAVCRKFDDKRFMHNVFPLHLIQQICTGRCQG